MHHAFRATSFHIIVVARFFCVCMLMVFFFVLYSDTKKKIYIYQIVSHLHCCCHINRTTNTSSNTRRKKNVIKSKKCSQIAPWWHCCHKHPQTHMQPAPLATQTDGHSHCAKPFPLHFIDNIFCNSSQMLVSIKRWIPLFSVNGQ